MKQLFITLNYLGNVEWNCNSFFFKLSKNLQLSLMERSLTYKGPHNYSNVVNAVKTWEDPNKGEKETMRSTLPWVSRRDIKKLWIGNFE